MSPDPPPQSKDSHKSKNKHILPTFAVSLVAGAILRYNEGANFSSSNGIAAFVGGSLGSALFYWFIAGITVLGSNERNALRNAFIAIAIVLALSLYGQPKH